MWLRVADCRPLGPPGNGLLPRGRQLLAVSPSWLASAAESCLPAVTPFPGATWHLTGRLAILADWGQLWVAALASWLCQDWVLPQWTSPLARCGFLFFSFHRRWFPVAFTNPTISCQHLHPVSPPAKVCARSPGRCGQSGGQRRG